MSALLARENRKLDHCRLLQRHARLVLRASLPRRDDPSRRGQTTIALGLQAGPTQLRLAAALARQLDDELGLDCFDWARWSPQALAAARRGGAASADLDFGALAAGVEALFAAKHPALPRNSDTVWGKKYKPLLRLLGARRGPCSEADLLALIRAIPSASSRKSSASLLRQAATQLGWPLDRAAISEAGRGYSRHAIAPRDIPDEALIEACLERIALPHWRWMYGMVWLFGIRPHEIAAAELTQRDGKYVLLIDDDTKTGARESWAFPDSKLEQHGLQHICRPPQGKHQVGRAAHLYLCSAKSDGRGGHRSPRLPFSLYALRHAYAIRLLVAGWPAEVGARLMGHSVQQHTETYQRWVNQRHMVSMHARFRDQLQ